MWSSVAWVSFVNQQDNYKALTECIPWECRFDYCNALLCGTLEMILDKHHCVQNNSARIVRQRGGRVNAGLLLRSLSSLACSEAAGHIQDGTDSPQGARHSNKDIPQRPGTHSCTGNGTAIIRRSANGRPSNHRSGTTHLQCRCSIHLERRPTRAVIITGPHGIAMSKEM